MLESAKSFFALGLGAIAGTWLRIFVIGKLNQYRFFKYKSVFIVNNISAFLLGSYFSLTNKLEVNNLYLFCVIGLLGSFSSFSSFIFDLYSLWSRKQIKEFCFLFIGSFLIGCASLLLGFKLFKVH
tara:strand:- start:3332 stop:3709 length:378 start_codon:yes stop_codon:yes gene_type:complete